MKTFFPLISNGYPGDLATGLAQTTALTADLIRSGHVKPDTFGLNVASDEIIKNGDVVKAALNQGLTIHNPSLVIARLADNGRKNNGHKAQWTTHGLQMAYGLQDDSYKFADFSDDDSQSPSSSTKDGAQQVDYGTAAQPTAEERFILLQDRFQKIVELDELSYFVNTSECCLKRLNAVTNFFECLEDLFGHLKAQPDREMARAVNRFVKNEAFEFVDRVFHNMHHFQGDPDFESEFAEVIGTLDDLFLSFTLDPHPIVGSIDIKVSVYRQLYTIPLLEKNGAALHVTGGFPSDIVDMKIVCERIHDLTLVVENFLFNRQPIPNKMIDQLVKYLNAFTDKFAIWWKQACQPDCDPAVMASVRYIWESMAGVCIQRSLSLLPYYDEENGAVSEQAFLTKVSQLFKNLKAIGSIRHESTVVEAMESAQMMFVIPMIYRLGGRVSIAELDETAVSVIAEQTQDVNMALVNLGLAIKRAAQSDSDIETSNVLSAANNCIRVLIRLKSVIIQTHPRLMHTLVQTLVEYMIMSWAEQVIGDAIFCLTTKNIHAGTDYDVVKKQVSAIIFGIRDLKRDFKKQYRINLFADPRFSEKLHLLGAQAGIFSFQWRSGNDTH